MSITAKSLRELSQTSFAYLATNTKLTKLSPGGKARAILDACNQNIAEAYNTFDLNLARAFLSSAPGQYLDLIGIVLGEPRTKPRAASISASFQNVKFYVDSGIFGDINGGNPITIPRGTLISDSVNMSGVLYRLTSSLTCSAASSSVWAAVEATSVGTDYNVGSDSLLYHDFVNYTDFANSSLKVTNVYPVVSGKDFETDENYRYRLSQKVVAAESANEIAIRLAALAVAGVSDVLVKKHYRGIGTFGVIVKSIQPVASDMLIESVKSAISSVQGFGSIASIRAQKELGFTLKTRVWYRKKLTDDEISDIEDTLIDGVEATINGLDLGETLYLDRLMADLFSASEEIIGFGVSGTPIDEAYIYKLSLLEDNRIPEKLLGDYAPKEDERIIVEPSVSSPIVFEHKFGNRTSE